MISFQVQQTTRIKVKEVKTRIPKRVIERQNLPKFGAALDNDVNVTIPSRDWISLDHPDDALLEEGDDPALGGVMAAFALKQQERLLERELDVEGLLQEEAEEEKVEKDTKQAGDKYVPPSLRGGRDKVATSNEHENTIRVSNLTKAVTEDDLRDLFSHFGDIFRVSLPRAERKDDNGNIVKEPRGFAYIAFKRHEDAVVAMEKLQGHGYDHLILKLEWAKPTPMDGPPMGGMNNRYVSGYGQKLAQETKEQVSYASNLTGNR